MVGELRLGSDRQAMKAWLNSKRSRGSVDGAAGDVVAQLFAFVALIHGAAYFTPRR